MSYVTKITNLQARSLVPFFAFVKVVRTADWITAVELGDADYKGKPTDGSRREVTIWQGPRSGHHQKVTFKYIWSSDHGWCLQALVFSGVNENGEWSQAFRCYTDFDGNWHFYPCILEQGWYQKNYEGQEHLDQVAKWLKR